MTSAALCFTCPGPLSRTPTAGLTTRFWPPLALQLATLPAHPESVPINALVAVKGTPMQDNEAPTGEQQRSWHDGRSTAQHAVTPTLSSTVH